MTDKEWTDRQLATLPVLVDLVKRERDRQHGKWGTQTHSPAEWALILQEEEGELARELLGLHFNGDHYTGPENLEAEAIQVATLALKIAEMVHTCERGP